jgi:hypothetical protein
LGTITLCAVPEPTPQPEHIYAALIVCGGTRLDGPEQNLTLLNVEAKSWATSSDSVTIDIVAFMSFYFVNARKGEHPVRLVIADAQAQPLHTFDTDPVLANGTAFVCANAILLHGLKLPLGLNSLYLLVDGEVRTAAGLHVIPAAQATGGEAPRVPNNGR